MIADARIGTQLAGYRIEAVIGRGGMSVVYLAEDIRLKRKVALKLLSPELAQSERFRERFVRESELAASLDHPNIIPIFEAGESDGALYIAMRYVEGTDLGALIELEGRLEPERTLALLAQAAGALDAAHARGLVHRDVKPGNMLIAAGSGRPGQEHLYLSDFGVTKRSTSDSGITGTGQFVGTLDYAAPEQFEGGALDARTDVYSLGCVLYQCLTGEVPFQRDTQAALVYAHLMSPPPAVTDKRPELPEGIDEVVATGMAKVPEKRYASAGDLVDAARKTLAAAAVIAPPAPQPSRSSRRGPILVFAGAALVAVVVLVAALVSRSGGGGPAPPSGSPRAGLAASDRVARISQFGSDAALARTLPVKAGGDPSAVAVGEGSVWVANQSDGTVSRIDPVTNTTRVIRVGNSPVAIADGEGSIWVVNRLSHSVSRIDPGSNKVIATVDLNVPGFPSTIAVGEGAVWVGVDGDYPLGAHAPAVHRIDPQTNRDVATFPLTNELVYVVITTGEGAVWAAGNGGLLIRIDPGSNDVRSLSNLRIAPAAITMADGVLWIASAGGGILRVDPSNGRILATLPGGGAPGLQGRGTYRSQLGMTFGNGIIWVTGKVGGTIDRVIADGNTVLEPLKVGQTPTGVAVGFGSVWVTVDVNASE